MFWPLACILLYISVLVNDGEGKPKARQNMKNLQMEYSEHTSGHLCYLLSRWPSASEARQLESLGRGRECRFAANGTSPYVVWA
jgi:hypothetical protein